MLLKLLQIIEKHAKTRFFNHFLYSPCSAAAPKPKLKSMFWGSFGSIFVCYVCRFDYYFTCSKTCSVSQKSKGIAYKNHRKSTKIKDFQRFILGQVRLHESGFEVRHGYPPSMRKNDADLTVFGKIYIRFFRKKNKKHEKHDFC